MAKFSRCKRRGVVYLKEPEICPYCGTPTTEKHTMFLSKTGFPLSVEDEILRLYEQRNYHLHIVCYNCLHNKKEFREFAWVEVSGQLWGWFWNGKSCSWRISELKNLRVKVQFT